MNFDFSEEQHLLREQARRFLAEQAGPQQTRQVLEGNLDKQRQMWRGLVDLGWTATVIPEHYGGAGLGYLELCVLAEELGYALTATPFTVSVYLATELLLIAGSEVQRQMYLPKLASGELIGTVAVQDNKISSTRCQLDKGLISGEVYPLADAEIADFAIISAQSDGRLSLFIVDLHDASVECQALETIDPSRPMARLRLHNTPAEPLADISVLEIVLDRAAILCAFEQLGGAQAALDMARDYALHRTAFGRAIGSFQAIKHKLADLYIAIELARSNCYFGAWALATGSAQLTVAAATARVSATQAYDLAAKENIQVHGGMGFTWHADCQLYYRRSKYLALLLGSQRRWKERLITVLAARNSAPGSSPELVNGF